jgi:hypothetical protein
LRFTNRKIEILIKSLLSESFGKSAIAAEVTKVFIYFTINSRTDQKMIASNPHG